MRTSRRGKFRIFPSFALACAFAVLLVIVGPGCGRTSLEPEWLDSAPTSASCGPSTCPTGCCDRTGACRAGSDLRACGSVGGLCADCVADGFDLCTHSGVCGRREPECNPSTCSGCCATEGGRLTCLSGTAPAACGADGVACSDCASDGRSCDLAKRACGGTRCDATTCNGCCVGDQCLPGDIESACGAKGAACSSCAVGQECQGQSGGGGKCEGTSTCGPSNCNGCCNALGQCVTGTDSTACGKQGQACEACDGGEVCVGAGPNAGTCQPLPTCGPGNCAGCCVNNSCVTATTPAACGANGQACVACGVNEVCSPQGTCVPSNPCASTCAGCCIGENCAPGTSTTACGTGGATCQNCSTIGRVCQSRSCQVPSCSPANCPNGCCSGNTCVVGTQHNACGPTGGGACTNCEAAGEVCQGRQCREKCGPLNCDGCCRPDNTCVLGLTNNACGQDGVTCSNCTTTGSFCNGLVTPRRCNDQQSTCPAPYGECPDGVRVPVRPALQKLCTGPNLNTLTTACAGGPHHPNCVAAFAALPDACRTCLEPFNVPFVEKAGLYACVASSVSPQCRRDMGCAIDCSRTSCTQCMSTSTDQCYALVNGNGGQCFTFDDDASCADAALSNGLCSSFAYPHFGAWLRSVGDHFCGDGP